MGTEKESFTLAAVSATEASPSRLPVHAAEAGLPPPFRTASSRNICPIRWKAAGPPAPEEPPAAEDSAETAAAEATLVELREKYVEAHKHLWKLHSRHDPNSFRTPDSRSWGSDHPERDRTRRAAASGLRGMLSPETIRKEIGHFVSPGQCLSESKVTWDGLRRIRSAKHRGWNPKHGNDHGAGDRRRDTDSLRSVSDADIHPILRCRPPSTDLVHFDDT
jgi:hypothetical protein